MILKEPEPQSHTLAMMLAEMAAIIDVARHYASFRHYAYSLRHAAITPAAIDAEAASH